MAPVYGEYINLRGRDSSGLDSSVKQITINILTKLQEILSEDAPNLKAARSMIKSLSNIDEGLCGRILAKDWDIYSMLAIINEEISVLNSEGITFKTRSQLLQEQSIEFFQKLLAQRNKLKEKYENTELVERVIATHIRSLQQANILPEPFELDAESETLAANPRFRAFITAEEAILVENTGKGLEQYVHTMNGEYEDGQARITAFLRGLRQQESDYTVQLIDGFNVKIFDALERYSDWLKYLADPDSDYLDPIEVRFMIAISIAKLRYHKSPVGFKLAEADTIDLIPELNREALGILYDELVQEDGRLWNQMVTSPQPAATLGSLYGDVLNNLTSEDVLSQELGKDGFWVTYPMSSEENNFDVSRIEIDADPQLKQAFEEVVVRSSISRTLSQSVRGLPGGWCTAGESTAINQLGGGDFHVFYTPVLDSKNQQRFVPRIAIRMNQAKVAEVRGRMPGQNLEEVMQSVISERLEKGDLDGAAEYFQKLENVRFLTELHTKAILRTSRLSKDELVKIFQKSEDLQTFGYGEDPRIRDIQQMLKDNPELWPEPTGDEGDADEVIKRLLNSNNAKFWSEFIHTNLDNLPSYIGQNKTAFAVQFASRFSLHKLNLLPTDFRSDNSLLDRLIQQIKASIKDLKDIETKILGLHIHMAIKYLLEFAGEREEEIVSELISYLLELITTNSVSPKVLLDLYSTKDDDEANSKFIEELRSNKAIINYLADLAINKTLPFEDDFSEIYIGLLRSMEQNSLYDEGIIRISKLPKTSALPSSFRNDMRSRVVSSLQKKMPDLVPDLFLGIVNSTLKLEEKAELLVFLNIENTNHLASDLDQAVRKAGKSRFVPRTLNFDEDDE